MLSLVLHPDQIQQLADELANARQREIGGVLVGEQLGPDAFRLVDLSVQSSGGTESCFVCDPAQHQSFLDRFFERTGANFARFNYLGEWHSHPLFTVVPSPPDLRQMQALVDEEPELRCFAILFVVRLTGRQRVELCALAFRPNYQPEAVNITIAPRPLGDAPMRKRSLLNRVLRPSPKLALVVARPIMTLSDA